MLQTTHKIATRERESQTELLRCIAIIMILLHHFAIHALYPEVLSLNVVEYGWDSHLILFFHSFILIGVNCFILISGFYGIKTTWRGFLRLYLIYAFYMLLWAIKHIYGTYIIESEIISFTAIVKLLIQIVFPFTFGGIRGMWFMSCYLGLFIMAPILNIAIINFTKQQFVGILVLLTLINVYFGNILNIGSLNNNGYTLMQFIYIYMIGSYISHNINMASIVKYRIHNIIGYVLCGFIWGGGTMLKVYYNIPGWYVFSYNNLFIVIMSILFFLFMMSWKFQSSFINKIAASSLGVYLLNDMVIKYDFLNSYVHAYSPAIQMTFWIGISIAFYLVAIVVDQLRIITSQPILSLYDKCFDRISKHFP